MKSKRKINNRPSSSRPLGGKAGGRAQHPLQRAIDDSPAMQRQRDSIEASFGQALQKQGIEEEELLQGRFEGLQRQPEEEEPLQGRFDGLQRQPEEEELLQGAFGNTAQLGPDAPSAANRTGMPDNLKQGIESLSGMDMSSVRVHYDSPRPAQLNAHAFAQGNDIHLGAGQEKHLPHEAWHVVQQREGRVRPTMELGGEKVNDDVALEREADAMGEKARRFGK